MVWLTIWSLAVSFAQNEISAIVFRALQGTLVRHTPLVLTLISGFIGLGAAATVPSAIGVICTYFAGKEQNRAMSCYGAAGAVGFVAGLILGGLLTASLGWVSPAFVKVAAYDILNVFSNPAMDLPRDHSPDGGFGSSCLVLLSRRAQTSHRCSAQHGHCWGLLGDAVHGPAYPWPFVIGGAWLGQSDRDRTYRNCRGRSRWIPSD